MGGGTGAFRGEVYASSEVGCEQERTVGAEIWTYEDEMERVLGAARILDENGRLDDILFFNILGETGIGIEGSLRSLDKSCFESFLSEVTGCF